VRFDAFLWHEVHELLASFYFGHVVPARTAFQLLTGGSGVGDASLSPAAAAAAAAEAAAGGDARLAAVLKAAAAGGLQGTIQEWVERRFMPPALHPGLPRLLRLSRQIAAACPNLLAGGGGGGGRGGGSDSGGGRGGGRGRISLPPADRSIWFSPRRIDRSLPASPRTRL
jgi:uncharacterized membrane protein YgcG